MFGRGRKTAVAVLEDGRAHCDMCGTTVPLLDDGHCDLGHRLHLLAQPAAPTQAAPPATGEAASPPPSSAALEERSAVAPSAPTPTGEDEDPFAHPYDEVLAWDGADHEPQAKAEPALDDLLDWDDDEAADDDFDDLTKHLPGLD